VQQRLLTWPHLDAVVFASYRYADEFLAGLHPSPQQESAVEQQITTTWQRLASRHIHVVIVGDVPGMRPTDDPTCLAESAAHNDPCAVRRSSVVASNVVAHTAQADGSLATFVPLTQFFCDAAKCHAIIGGVVVYFDAHHMTTTFSRSLARYLGGSVAMALN
jgi:hypothetical protein